MSSHLPHLCRTLPSTVETLMGPKCWVLSCMTVGGKTLGEQPTGSYGVHCRLHREALPQASRDTLEWTPNWSIGTFNMLYTSSPPSHPVAVLAHFPDGGSENALGWMAGVHAQRLRLQSASQGDTANLRFSATFGKTKGGCQHPVWCVAGSREGIPA